ncbi:MAG: ABC transporter substrate-binding protein, partial [Burkholderiales bacterium]|nr:ABC transporter substrate-binding protein [Burkholderiales bacterium]
MNQIAAIAWTVAATEPIVTDVTGRASARVAGGLKRPDSWRKLMFRLPHPMSIGFAIVSALAVAAGDLDAQPVKIAGLVELSGSGATAGTNFNNGVKLAIREINSTIPGPHGPTRTGRMTERATEPRWSRASSRRGSSWRIRSSTR